VAGVGGPLTKPQTPALMAARINCLLKAHSGIRVGPIQLLMNCLNQGVLPVVPSQGSVGASGDLAPLAHMALLLVGEGLAWHGEKHIPGGEALAQAGLSPVTLQAKEGLALINGTQLITSLGNLALQVDGEVDVAEASGSLLDFVRWRLARRRVSPGILACDDPATLPESHYAGIVALGGLEREADIGLWALMLAPRGLAT